MRAKRAHRWTLGVAGALLAVLLVGPRVDVTAAQNIPEDVIVLFREGVSRPDRAAAVRRAGAVLRFNYVTVNAAAAHLPAPAIRRLLEGDPNVAQIIPDRPVQAHARPEGKGNKGGGGTSQVVPEGVKRIGAAPEDVTYTFTGFGVGVAIVDTGIDFNHADLQVAAACFTAFSSCQDDDGHGTHVAGTVAALNNGQDVVGVAPEATLYSVKVLNGSGSGTDSTVMAGFDWIAQKAGLLDPPILVVNVSLGRQGTLDDNPALRASVQALHEQGISVVVSAGNEASLEVSQQVPATYPEVMAVASTTAIDGSNGGCRFFRDTIKADTASYFTTDGAFVPTPEGWIGVTISAPGEDKENVTKSCFASSVGILSTRLGGGTARMSGTSMSAPHVTGVVALMWDMYADVPPEYARDRLRGSSPSAGATPFDSPTGGYSFDGELEGVLWAPGALQ